MVIIQSGGVIEYEYTVDTSSLNVDFLALCKSYNFVVTPEANHISGVQSSLIGTIALPTGKLQNFKFEIIVIYNLINSLIFFSTIILNNLNLTITSIIHRRKGNNKKSYLKINGAHKKKGGLLSLKNNKI